jgi:hypothetical protein
MYVYVCIYVCMYTCMCTSIYMNIHMHLCKFFSPYKVVSYFTCSFRNAFCQYVLLNGRQKLFCNNLRDEKRFKKKLIHETCKAHFTNGPNRKTMNVTHYQFQEYS